MRLGCSLVNSADSASREGPDVREGGKLGDAVPQQYLVTVDTLSAEDYGG